MPYRTEEILGADDLAMGDESMGAYEIQGDELSGASLPHPRLKATRPMSGRRLPLGVRSNGPVGAFPAQATIKNQPQVLFRLERFVVPSDIAGFFDIEDIIVGTASVFAAQGAVPARAFDEQATSVLLGTDTNQPATDLTTKVTNLDVVPHLFRACYIGVAVI